MILGLASVCAAGNMVFITGIVIKTKPLLGYFFYWKQFFKVDKVLTVTQTTVSIGFNLESS